MSNLKQEVESLVRQRGELDKAISDRFVELGELMVRRSGLDDRISRAGLEEMDLVPVRVGYLSPLNKKIVRAIEDALRKDQSGAFGSELDKVLNL